MTSSIQNRPNLASFITEEFTNLEIQDILNSLNISFDLAEGTDDVQAVEVILKDLEENGRLEAFFARAQASKPTLNWQQFNLQRSEINLNSHLINQRDGNQVVGNTVGGDIVFGDKYAGVSKEEIEAIIVRVTKASKTKAWTGINPYMGLNAYGKDDARYFYGRTKLVNELIQKIDEADFLAISGASGSGKSSVAKAGVLYQLGNKKKLAGSGNWEFLSMTPSIDPFEQLGNAINHRTQNHGNGNFIKQEGRTNPLAFYEFVNKTLLSNDKGQRCVLLIDQFEEIFTLTDVENRNNFINLITSSVSQENGRIKIFITIRHEFIADQCSAYPKLLSLINNKQHTVGGMTPEDLVSAITLPSIEVGVKIEPVLVHQIVQEMKNDPGALPLMSFALKDLFDKESKEKGLVEGDFVDLKLVEYQNHGGLTEALERHASKAFNQFTDKQKDLTKMIFSNLVTVGSQSTDTRRIVPLEDLLSTQPDATQIQEIINELNEKRLIIIGSDLGQTDQDGNAVGKNMVTLSHEKLIDAWPWLKNLIKKDRNRIEFRNQIEGEAKKWRKQKELDTNVQIRNWLPLFLREKRYPSDDYLRHGGKLAQLDEDWHSIKSGISKNAHDYYEQSLNLKNHSGRASQFRLGLISLIAVGLIVLGVVVYYQREEAFLQRHRSVSQIFFIQSQRSDSNETSLKLALEALALDSSIEGGNGTIIESHLFDLLQGEVRKEERDFPVTAVEFNSKLSLLITAKDDGIIELWKIDELVFSKYREFTGHTERIWDLTLNFDNSKLASASNDGTIRIWDLQDFEAPPVLISTDGSSNFGVAFHPQKNLIAVVGDRRILEIYDLDSPEQTKVSVAFEGDGGYFNDVEYRPDGTQIVLGGIISSQRDDGLYHFDGSIYFVDAENPTPENTIKFEHGIQEIFDLTFADNSTLLTAESDFKIWQYAVSGDLAPSDYIEIGSHNSKIRNLEVSADGTQLLSASEDGTIRLWSLDAPRLPIKTFAGHLNFVFDAIFFNQEEFIISASQDRSIRLWDIENKFTSVFMSHTVPLHALAVNNNTNLIATADTNGTVYWWDMRQFDQEPNILLLEEEGHDGFVQALAFEPNQRILASAGREGSIIIWDLIRSNPIQQIPEAHDDSIRSLAYSPDGSYLASSSFDETVKIWDMETPSQEPIKILRDHNEDVRTLIFHPDGAWLATGAWDGRIILWNWETGDTVMWEEHTASVRSLTITPDGNVLVSADRGGIIKMWDISGIVENNELVEPKVYHDALVTYGGSVDAIMFSPDSRYLYSAGEDKSILVWDWANLNQPPLSMSTAHKLPIVKIQYLEETNQIMSLSEDGQIWKTQLIENFAKEVCDQIIQPLTEQEYQEIVGENEIDRPISCQSEP